MAYLFVHRRKVSESASTRALEISCLLAEKMKPSLQEETIGAYIVIIILI